MISKAETALRKAVAEAIESHKRLGQPIVVWRHGKIARVVPEQLVVREKPTNKYGL